MPLLQEIAAVSLVCVAAVYVAYRSWRVLVKKQTGGCGGGGCPTCPSGKQEASSPAGFVPLDELTDQRGFPNR
jgi:hypothetical protein